MDEGWIGSKAPIHVADGIEIVGAIGGGVWVSTITGGGDSDSDSDYAPLSLAFSLYLSYHEILLIHLSCNLW